MSTKLILIAAMIGAIAAITGAMVYFGNSEFATAQMSGAQLMGSHRMDAGMMTTQLGKEWLGNQGSMFNANGMSVANNVQITGITVSGSDEITIRLKYDGIDSSPAITVMAITNPMTMMQSASGIGGMRMMYGSQSGMMMQPMMSTSSGAATTWQNNTQWQQWHSQMANWHGQLNSTQWAQMQSWHNQIMAQGAVGPGHELWNLTSATWPGQSPVSQSQAGSSTLEAGWASESTVTVRLEGEGSTYDSTGIHVMVFPLTS